MQEQPKKRTNVHIYQSAFRNESRILKITSSLSRKDYFDRILILAIHEDGLGEVEKLDEVRTVYRLRTRTTFWIPWAVGKLMQRIEWLIRCLWFCVKVRAVCVNPHSLLTLPTAVAVKFLTGATVIYDTHELETESSGLNSITKPVARILERAFIGGVDSTVVVGEQISDWYSEKYANASVTCIKNFPPSWDELIVPGQLGVREGLGIKASDLVFLYIGRIATGRGVELLNDIFLHLPLDRHLVFLGDGPLVGRLNLERGNIHHHTSVAPSSVASVAASADVGLCLIENVCLSYYYSMPNKMFECLSAGLPVVASDFPEIGGLIEKYGCGWTVDLEEGALSRKLLGISRDAVRERGDAAKRVRQQFTWETQEPALYRLYDGFFQTRS